MTDKIKKAEYLDRLERKKKVLGIGVDLTKDLEHLVNLEKKAKKSNDVKDIERLKKQLTLVKNDIDNRLLQQEKNIKQSQDNIDIEMENLETANANKDFLNKIKKEINEIEL